MKRLYKSFRYSIDGIISCYNNEPAFRLECYTLLVAVPLAIWIGETAVEYILLIGSIILIMVVELLNSAIENVNDRIGTEYNELCKFAKDQSSAAVFATIILAGITWLLIFFM